MFRGKDKKVNEIGNQINEDRSKKIRKCRILIRIRKIEERRQVKNFFKKINEDRKGFIHTVSILYNV